MGSQSIKHHAFALGGLAGSNAWGAGFLHAALENKYKDSIHPSLISCTSGQLYWVCAYLQLKGGGEFGGKSTIQDLLQGQIAETQHYHLSAPVPLVGGVESQDLDYLELCWSGIPHKFHVPFLKNWTEAGTNLLTALPRAVVAAQESKQVFLLKELARIWPANFLTPDFPDEMYRDIAMTITGSDIGVCFNAYHPQKGKEFVYVNKAAREVFAEAGKELVSYRKRTIMVNLDNDTERQREEAVQAVRQALWLIFYGPPDSERPIDAAYYRHVMLRELVPAEAIFVVRPINYHWHGPVPNRFLDMLDFLTQAYFNGIYAGEREHVATMNKLCERHPPLQEFYHHIDLWEIEPDEEESLAGRDLVQGFFDYVFEETALFDAACTLTRDRFDRFLAGEEPPELAISRMHGAQAVKTR